MRVFNTAGPTNCQKHYCVPPLTRFSLDDILGMIDRARYFVLHAPRQVGKTTYLKLKCNEVSTLSCTCI